MKYLRIKVIPKSNRNEIVETFTDADGEETIKIRIKAAPEKGKANAELIKFLSKEWELPRAAIEIVSGKTERLKLIKLKD